MLLGSAIFLSACTSTPAENSYSMEQVAKHNSKSDCWLAIDGGVYEVTGFVSVHPGGEEIVKGCGKDATGLFNGEKEHGGEAKDQLKDLKIGIVAAD